MLSSFNNPWFTVVTDPLWTFRQATQTAARCVDAEFLSDLQALVSDGAEQREQRLNPFDFHGRRRPASRVGARRSALESEADARDASAADLPHGKARRPEPDDVAGHRFAA